MSASSVSSGAYSSVPDVNPLLPPFHISKLSSSIRGSSYRQKIKKIVESVFLISDHEHEPFKKIKSCLINQYRVLSYCAIARNRNPIFEALEKESSSLENDGSESPSASSASSSENSKGYKRKHGQYEFLIFIFREKIDGDILLLNSNIYVLSTNKAAKVISRYCSRQFSEKLRKNLANEFIRIDEVIKSHLLGPIAESNHHTRGLRPLPIEVEQSRTICRGFTATLRPFTRCIEGESVRVMFGEIDILIFRDLSLKSYTKIIHTFDHFKCIPDSEDQVIDELSGQLKKLEDPDLVERLESLLLNFMIFKKFQTESDWNSTSDGWTILEFEVCESLFSKADEYRMHIVHNKGKPYGTESWLSPFDNPYSIPSIADLQDQLAYYHIVDDLDYVFISHKLVNLEYKVEGIWYQTFVLDCIEGCFKAPDGQIYYKMGGFWYEIGESYLTEVQGKCERILDSSLIRPRDLGALPKWPVGMGEVPYNKSVVSNKKRGGIWFDGNSKRFHECEIFDILGAYPDVTFIYHVKKVFNKEIRVAVTQLLISAQVMRNHIDQGKEDSKFTAYCNTVAGKKKNQSYKKLLIINYALF